MSIIILLPLLGFLVSGIVGKYLPKQIVGLVSTLSVVLSFAFALHMFLEKSILGEAVSQKWFTFLQVGGMHIDVAFTFDRLSGWMTLIITGIGSLIHLYSMGYMKEDEGYYKFFAYLNLFVFNMLLLVLGSNFIMLFFGWEGVGLCSYLLIGFWYKNLNYGKAARKAFVMNRIGDLGLLLGLFLIFKEFKSFDYTVVFDQIASGVTPTHTLTAIALLLFVGAMGKSAQIPLYTWLPDAMAGPTPVSALIHAATMVTAGVYLVVRSQALYYQTALASDVIMWVGLATSLFAALIGLKQNDIKKVLAYSTVSQLGLMFVALGCGAYTAAMFHLTTHAFFKALLFLGSGSVIHGMHHEQDIRKMGGLKSKMPVTYITFLIGTLAITGFPFLSGFFSKDEILLHAFSHNPIVWGLALVSASITGFYMFRMFFVTFHGTYRNTHYPLDKVHESPITMTLPLIFLAILSVLGGLLNLPHYFGHKVSGAFSSYLAPMYKFAEHSPEVSSSTEWMLLAAAVGVFVIAFIAMRIKYVSKNGVPEEDEQMVGLGKVLANKFYVDEIYDTGVVAPVEIAGTITDGLVDDIAVKGITDSIGKTPSWISSLLSKIQNGNIEYYLIYMVVAVSILLAINLF